MSHSGRRHPKTATMVPYSWCRGIQQSSNMLHELMVVAMAGLQWEIGWLGVNLWTKTSTKVSLGIRQPELLIGALKCSGSCVKSYTN